MSHCDNLPSIFCQSIHHLSSPSNNFSSETRGPIFFKFNVEPSVEGGLKIYKNGHSQLIKKAAMLIYGKNILKSSSSEPGKLYC